MNTYEHFLKLTFGEKVEGYEFNEAARAAIDREAATIPGSVGEIGRAVLAYGNAHIVADRRGCSVSHVYRCYRTFRIRMKHPRHSKHILKALGLPPDMVPVERHK